MNSHLATYSYTLYADYAQVQRDMPFLCRLLKNGIKVLIFTNKEIDSLLVDIDVAVINEAKLLQYMVVDHSIETSMKVIDGLDIPLMKKIANQYPRFNIEQFIIEHAPYKENIMVKAGAGTGKTTVMIDRILYLLIKEKVKPSEIVMITFTRDAAQNMQTKLRSLLFNRFKATSSVEFLLLIEKLNDIRIQTIDSFAKDLLKELGSLRGFGLNVQLRSFTMEKKKWIEEELDNYFEEELKKQDVVIQNYFSPLKIYELVDIINRFWEKFEQKGFSTAKIIECTDSFGSASEGNKRMNDLLQTIIPAAEKRFSQEKRLLNAVTISDFTRQIDQVRKEHGTRVFQNISKPIRFLFIDEFQDSDDIQIRLIATIQEAFESTLFVVGDIKQSIYRFRGANHTAFSILKKQLQERNIDMNDLDYYLVKNYRTTRNLLDNMDEYFSSWGEKQFLQYAIDMSDKNTDRLQGMKSVDDERPFVIDAKREENKEDMKTHIMPYIQERYRQIKEINKEKTQIENVGEEKEKLAVLTRTIEEARLIDRWCKEMNLPTKLKVGGDFFTSKAVRDFYSLTLLLLYPKNKKYLANVLNGPYGQNDTYLLHELLVSNGKNVGMNMLIKESSNIDFQDYINQLKYQPVLAVLRSIIQEVNPYNWIYSRKLDELKENQTSEFDEEQIKQEAAIYTKQYELNAGKLFEMMHQRFSEEFVSLHQITNWLYIQIATNREEDEIQVQDIEKGLDHVHILTVHRAKGLEYHTVIIPFTERLFTTSFSKIIFDEQKEKIGWFIRKPGFISKQNDYYNALTQEEDDEAIKEETRLLYVAMTRAKNQLVIIRNRKNEMYDWWTWSRLLS
ncbi:UvrD-helicase domain-containing protein [Bacillus arachidis]|uniref:UvrD-helicase domain-containing protein n=1 Tax=Bacillus arachidis TaxID=2819290 RepID=UPI00255C4EA5|nr:UvrD-helicase domain-containing protein [Bacillus arachidis]WIY62160.1 UvrD-helicase domain-containing protein [Bacillus arachidis]